MIPGHGWGEIVLLVCDTGVVTISGGVGWVGTGGQLGGGGWG